MATTATPVTDTTAPVPATGLVWTGIASDEAIFGGPSDQEMSGVVMGGPGLVAVGSDTSGGDADGAVWTSSDGVTWARVPHDEAVFGGSGNQWMYGVVEGGPGLVAVGFDGSDGLSDAAVWASPDGVTWTRVPSDAAVFGGDNWQQMSAVVVGGPGLVAVGYDLSGGLSDAAVWTSPDGYAWSRVPHDEAVFGGSGDQEMSAVAAGGPGLVAVGHDYSDDGDAAVWTSPDGVTWSRVPHDEAVLGGSDSQFMRGVVAGGPGLVAVGFDYSGVDGDAAVWTSPDGVAWTRVPHDGAVFGGPDSQHMWAVMAGGPGFVAAGTDYSIGDGDLAVWTSPDGVTWARVPHDDAVFGGPEKQVPRAVVAGGPGVVIVGFISLVEADDEWDAAVWVGAPTG